MANITPFDPFDLLEGMMKSVLRPSYQAMVAGRDTAGGGIPIDVVENDTSYLLWADLPGVDKEDVGVSIHGNQVTVTAEAKREKAVDQGQGKEIVLCNERRSGTLTRQLHFAAEIDDAKATAQYRDGVLQLTLPKKASAQVKRLAIH